MDDLTTNEAYSIILSSPDILLYHQIPFCGLDGFSDDTNQI